MCSDHEIASQILMTAKKVTIIYSTDKPFFLTTISDVAEKETNYCPQDLKKNKIAYRQYFKTMHFLMNVKTYQLIFRVTYQLKASIYN